jgi:MHS family shikimate/dehydroshikimate transporter-like MFS transporter
MSSIAKIAGASFVGTAIEFYDFFLYGIAAALVFNRLFFPTFDPLVGTLAAFATFAVGFISRPLGGVVFGHFGDRLGRRSMLVLTLLIMGLATTAIGLLPTYEQAGVLAPVLLVGLRFLQGIGLGGEWGGAVLMAVEHAPANRRGFYGSFPQIGGPAGLVLANGAFALIATLPEAALLTWGWRLPFLFSLVLVAVGLFVRHAIPESPVFRTLKQQAPMPALDAVRRYPKQILLTVGASSSLVATVYVVTTFLLSYATQTLGQPRQLVLTAVLIGAAIQVLGVPAFGALSDRVGRRPVFVFGAVFGTLMAFPFFWLLESGQVMLALILGTIGPSAMFGPQASFFAELFGTHVRYSGASIGYQLATVIAGGLTPFIATALLTASGSTTPIAWYMVTLGALSVASVWAATETRGRDLYASGAAAGTAAAAGGGTFSGVPASMPKEMTPGTSQLAH